MNDTIAPEANVMCIPHWVTHMKENGYGAATIRSYSSAGRALLSYAQGDHENGWVNRYFNTRRANLSAASLQVHRAAARHLFGYLGQDAPLVGYRMPPIAPREAHPLPNGMEDVYKMLYASSDNRDRNLTVALCGLAGLRISEAIACTLSDFNWSTMRLRIKGKGEKIRYVPIAQALQNQILYWLDFETVNHPDERLVRYGNTGARKGITACGRDAGLDRPVASHDLRMTFATHIYRETKDIRLIQDLLGHSSIETTQIYVGLDAEDSRAAVNAAFENMVKEDEE